jgi:predicted Zn-dependent protease
VPPAENLLALPEIVSRAERLLTLSPADATSVAWLERRRNLVSESARGRRAETGVARDVHVRVRLSGRTGAARAESAEPSALERALREALAVARAAETSPEWEVAALAAEPERLDGLVDADLGELETAAGAELLERLAERRATLTLRWADLRVAVVSSFHAPRAARATEATLEARTGRRPGSGFAAGSSRRLAALDPEALLARARALEAPQFVEDVPAAAIPVVLAPEAAAALIEAWSRRAFSGRRALAGRALAAPPSPRSSPYLELADDPLEPAGLPFPFDLDGVAKRGRTLVAAGACSGPAVDLELAARLAAPPTGNGMAADDAWPQHPRVLAGTASEADLLSSATGGVRVGALEQLAVGAETPFRFRAVARSVRRIGPDGTLGVALAPMIWQRSCEELFAALESRAVELVFWAPRSNDGLGVTATPALRFAPVDGFSARLVDR